MFRLYLQLGFSHISDIAAYDHMLFLFALCAIYKLAEWKKVAILVTAFTIGHSITLALAALDVIQFSPELIERLIPITIILTAIYNMVTISRTSPESQKIQFNYIFALIFGCIHGMAFSNELRSLLMPGEENQLVVQLLAFNIGIELGQLLIVLLILIVSYIALDILKLKQKYWIIGISVMAILISIHLLLNI